MPGEFFNFDPFTVLPDENGDPWILGRHAGGPIHLARHKDRPGIWEVRVIGDDEPVDAIRSLSQLEHDRIAVTLLTARAGGGHYAASEHPAGGTLAQAVASHGPLAWPLVRWIVLQIADALEHAHAAGIHHGALSPACIHLAEPWPELKIKVAGFANEGDEATDLFALGVSIIGLLGGADPPDGKSIKEAAAGSSSRLALLESLPAGVPAEAKELVANLLDRQIPGTAALGERLVNDLLDGLPEAAPEVLPPPQEAVVLGSADPPPPLHPPEPAGSVPAGKSSLPWPKIAAAAAAVALMGGAAVFFLNKPDPSPPPADHRPSEAEERARRQAEQDEADRQKAEQALAVKAAREQAERDLAQQEKAARDLAEKERLAKEKEAMELVAREKAEKERAEKERIAMEQAAKEKAAREAGALLAESETVFADPKSPSSTKAALFPRLLELARAGNVKAIELCGACYWQGNGVEKDPVEASRWFEKGATLDNSRSMLGLGNCYEQGIRVPRDSNKATEWWRKAAAKGEPLAMSRLGEYYNAQQDIKQAMNWWQQAADLGVPEAMTNLGIHHAAGTAGEKNAAKAVELWENAVKLGEPRAMAELGYLYFNGEVPGKDKKDAFQLFEKAVAANDPRAMTGLGVCYLTGSGTTASRSEAEKWLRKASDLGEPTAAQYLKKLNPSENR